MEKRYLYIMLSKTDTGVGWFIRTLFRYEFNHVSLSLDPSFRNWVAFGRYFRDTTFYGGFVKEPAERFLAKGYDVRVRIFRLEISEEKFRSLQVLFSRAGERDGVFVYNFVDAILSFLRCKMDIPGAYTCLSFACAVLEERYLTIRGLDEALTQKLVYAGPLNALVPDSGDRSDPFFSRLGFREGLHCTAKYVGIMLHRLVCRRCADQARARYTL